MIVIDAQTRYECTQSLQRKGQNDVAALQKLLSISTFLAPYVYAMVHIKCVVLVFLNNKFNFLFIKQL